MTKVESTPHRGRRLWAGITVGSSLLLLSACAGTNSGEGTAAATGSAAEVRSSYGLYKVGKPYQIKGVWYYPQIDYDYVEEGVASWYGPGFHGKATANGETYDQNDMTAAHRTLPLPSIVRVTNLENGRSIKVRVNDRGPFAQNRIIDMTRRGAQMLGFYGAGTARVRVEVVADESRQLAFTMTGSEYPGGAMVANRQPTAPIDGSTPPVPVVAASSLEPGPMPSAFEVASAEPQASAVMPAVMTDVAPLDVGQTPVDQTPIVQTAAAYEPVASTYPAVGSTYAGYSPSDGQGLAAADVGALDGAAPTPAVSSAALPEASRSRAPSSGHYAAVPAAAPAVAIPPKPTSATGGARAYVQAGAFANAANADKVRQKLSRFGPVAVVNLGSGGQPLYRVRLGPLNSAGEAERMLTTVIDAGFPGSRVVIE